MSARTAWVAIGILITGCGPSLQDLSSGKVGCAPSQIVITSDESGLGGTRTWTATCAGKTFYCSATRRQDGTLADVGCKEGAR